MLKEILSAVDVRKTDQTTVSPGVGQLSQGGNDLAESLRSSHKLVLGIFYLVPGVVDLLRFFLFRSKELPQRVNAEIFLHHRMRLYFDVNHS